MHQLLAKLLKKKGIEDVTTLSDEDQVEYRKWEAVLSAKPLSVDTIKQFCENQIAGIEKVWEDIDNSKEKNQRLIIQHVIYKKLIQVIDSPDKEKERLESYLQSLLQ